jgi:hypothetical protein
MIAPAVAFHVNVARTRAEARKPRSLASWRFS